MLDMGFINDVKKIERLCPKKKQTLLFSATIPEKIDELAKTMLYKPVKVEINPEETTDPETLGLLGAIYKRLRQTCV